MAMISPCTGTTAQWSAVAGTLILKEREIGIEIASRTDGTTYVIIRQGDGETTFLSLDPIFDQSAYEDAVSTTKSNMETVTAFTSNMNAATAAANTAASSANTAASAANAAAEACEGALNGMNTMVDTVTNTSCVLSVEDGLLTIREA